MFVLLGELAIQSSPEQLQPYAAPIVERLLPILAAPMAQMPRSIIENRSASDTVVSQSRFNVLILAVLNL